MSYFPHHFIDASHVPDLTENPREDSDEAMEVRDEDIIMDVEFTDSQKTVIMPIDLCPALAKIRVLKDISNLNFAGKEQLIYAINQIKYLGENFQSTKMASYALIESDLKKAFEVLQNNELLNTVINDTEVQRRIKTLYTNRKHLDENRARLLAYASLSPTVLAAKNVYQTIMDAVNSPYYTELVRAAIACTAGLRLEERTIRR